MEINDKELLKEMPECINYDDLFNRMKKAQDKLFDAVRALSNVLKDSNEELKDCASRFMDYYLSCRQDQIARFIRRGVCVGTVFRVKSTEKEYTITGFNGLDFIVTDFEIGKEYKVNAACDLKEYTEIMSKIEIIKRFDGETEK